MKNYRLFFALLLCLLGANCNPSAKTKQAIKELEEQVASLESDIRTLTDEITRVTPKPGSLDPESARQLQEKYKALNEKVSKLAQMESDYGRLTRDNASLRKQLATAVKSAGTAGVLDQDGTFQFHQPCERILAGGLIARNHWELLLGVHFLGGQVCDPGRVRGGR
jgi:prefoldin subunit 5